MTARSEELASRLKDVRTEIVTAARGAGRDPDEITLIVVTKNFPTSDAQILWELGERNFGENRDQEAGPKSLELPPDITWHFQGQVQSKKIKSIVQWADVVHSLDSLDHAEKFNHFPRRAYFIQLSFEPEAEHRGGVPVDGLSDFYNKVSSLENLQISGLMVVPPLASDPQQIFSRVAQEAANLGLTKLSMGMSGDYREAIAAGATHIRVGSSILGSRTLPA